MSTIPVTGRQRAMDTVQEALLEAPGARASQSGAYGSGANVSLRGSEADQVLVLFGDLPLTGADGSPFDLSTLPLWALQEIQVYRGGAPTWLGGSAMGGVLRLVPRRTGGPALCGGLGVGSFGYFSGQVCGGVHSEGLSLTTVVGAASSEGDFPLLLDRTPLSPGDEVVVNRQNAAVRDLSALVHLTAPLYGGRLSLMGFAFERIGGLPGPSVEPTERAHRNQVDGMASVGFERLANELPPERAHEADYRVQGALGVAFRNRRVTDLARELGVARNTDDEGLRFNGRLAISGLATSYLELTGVGLFVHEGLSPSDSQARIPNGDSSRVGGDFALETRLFGTPLGLRSEIRVSGRLNVTHSSLQELRAERAGEEIEHTRLGPGLRVALAIEPMAGLTLSSSVATAVRLPNMVELFGDRGYLLGDTRLLPERAELIDLSLVWAGRSGELSGRLELRGFLNFSHDLIRYRRTSAYQAVPQNVAAAELMGGELGLRGRFGRHLGLTGALSLLHTQTPLGTSSRSAALPLRPWLTSYLRPYVQLLELGPVDQLRLYVEMNQVSQSFADPSNLVTIDGRLRFGAGLSVGLWRKVRLDVSLRDIFDQGGQDRLGFPLPGRSFAVKLSLET